MFIAALTPSTIFVLPEAFSVGISKSADNFGSTTVSTVEPKVTIATSILSDAVKLFWTVFWKSCKP